MSAPLSRRHLLRALGVSGAGLFFAPGFPGRALAASPQTPARRALVTVFLRGHRWRTRPTTARVPRWR